MSPALTTAAATSKSAPPKFSLFPKDAVVDPKIASLFSDIARQPQNPALNPLSKAPKPQDSSDGSSSESEESSEVSSSDSESGTDGSDAGLSPDSSEISDQVTEISETLVENTGQNEESADEVDTRLTQTKRKKRKREGEEEDDLESAYLTKLAREEQKEDVAHDHLKRKKLDQTYQQSKPKADDEGVEDETGDNENESEDEEHYVPPQHETITGSAEYKLGTDFDKASRTVFLANVSNEAVSSKSAKRTIIAHLKSFLADLTESSSEHNLESLRFRSTAYSTPLPKRAAFARKDLMDSTTKSTNAYAVYTTKIAAKEAARRLNGTVVLGRHLRVDEVAHPAKIDHHRCIFVGNLGYVDDESQVREEEAERTGRKQRKKNQMPGDVEEGLWQTFSKLGKVENVRVVRDAKTRVGKGFGYVQFADDVAIEEALLLDGKRFPPLLPRKLRVSRAKKPSKKRPSEMNTRASDGGRFNKSTLINHGMPSKPDSKTASNDALKGRARKLLGRAGAANIRGLSKTLKKPEEFIFEGYRASSKGNVNGLIGNAGGSGRKKGDKPRTRSAKRGAAWKAKGSKTKK